MDLKFTEEDWIENIKKLRIFGDVRCFSASPQGVDLNGMLLKVGLFSDASLLTEIDLPTAKRTLERLLASSLVDSLEVMPKTTARDLSEAFFKDLQGVECSLYTNSDWLTSDSFGFNPLTHSVFDGGVIAFGPAVFACVWIEEDA